MFYTTKCFVWCICGLLSSRVNSFVQMKWRSEDIRHAAQERAEGAAASKSGSEWEEARGHKASTEEGRGGNGRGSVVGPWHEWTMFGNVGLALPVCSFLLLHLPVLPLTNNLPVKVNSSQSRGAVPSPSGTRFLPHRLKLMKGGGGTVSTSVCSWVCHFDFASPRLEALPGFHLQCVLKSTRN